jgi:hypothetical protein
MAGVTKIVADVEKAMAATLNGLNWRQIEKVKEM